MIELPDFEPKPAKVFGDDYYFEIPEDDDLERYQEYLQRKRTEREQKHLQRELTRQHKLPLDSRVYRKYVIREPPGITYHDESLKNTNGLKRKKNGLAENALAENVRSNDFLYRPSIQPFSFSKSVLKRSLVVLKLGFSIIHNDFLHRSSIQDLSRRKSLLKRSLVVLEICFSNIIHNGFLYHSSIQDLSRRKSS